MSAGIYGAALLQKPRAAGGAERVASPVDLVLAIDVTASMEGSIYTRRGGNVPAANRRINVVRNAALLLIDALYDQDGDTGHVSVGLVPFNTTVNIGVGRQAWVSDLGQGHKVIPSGFGSWRAASNTGPWQTIWTSRWIRPARNRSRHGFAQHADIPYHGA